MDSFWAGFEKQAGLKSFLSKAKEIPEHAKAIREQAERTGESVRRSAESGASEVKKTGKFMRGAAGLGVAGGLGIGGTALGFGIASSNAKRKMYNELAKKVKGDQ